MSDFTTIPNDTVKELKECVRDIEEVKEYYSSTTTISNAQSAKLTKAENRIIEIIKSL